MLTDPKNVRKALQRLVDLLADEAERNPAFAEALAELVTPSHTTTRSKSKEEAALDPFSTFQTRGKEGLRAALIELSIEQLRSIVRQHRFDPSRLSDKWKSRERFIEVICDRVEARSRQGDAFRHYGKTTGGQESSPSSSETPQ
jgi:hypothetical protein